MTQPPPDFDAIWEALPALQQQAALEAFEMLCLGDAWWRSPTARRWLVLLAVAAEAERIRDEGGGSEQGAVQRAGFRLNLNGESMHTLLRRQRALTRTEQFVSEDSTEPVLGSARNHHREDVA